MLKTDLSWQQLELASVKKSENGRAIQVLIANQLYPVGGQADHIGYLQKEDHVICGLIDMHYIILGRLLTQTAMPADTWQQVNEEQCLFQFGASQISLNREGKIHIANEHASFSLHDDGRIEAQSQDFHIESVQHIHIETTNGSIYCHYPEEMQ